MLVDANVLLYAADASAPRHEAANRWLNRQLEGPRRVGLPWNSLAAFVRIMTHPRASKTPMDPVIAWGFVEGWLASDVAWIPVPTPRHAEVFGGLVRTHRLAGKLVPDAHFAALAIEHGLTIYSNDSDFARFPEVTWVNPLHGAS